ncbi:MAG TPA: hypothetical protein DCS43_07880 [Verrucomicrobia bacterium]|nr:hypothetical protein [Verrucomicrobiota bacterium]
MKLTKEEKDILDSVEGGEWKRIPHYKQWAVLPILAGLLLIGGFKLQQFIAPFRGIATGQDGAYQGHFSL